MRKWRKLPLEKLTRAERNMLFVETYCRVPEGALVGQPIQLADFQERFFYALYDNPHGTRRAYLSIARKNSKTATIAAILLVHLVGPEAQLNSHIQSGAMSLSRPARSTSTRLRSCSSRPSCRAWCGLCPAARS